MKKTILLSFAFFTAVCCDCKCPTDDNTQTDKPIRACVSITSYPNNTDPNTGAAWLRANGEEICYDDTFRAVVKQAHVYALNIADINTAKTPLPLTRADFESMTSGISNYGCYIGFNIVNGQISSFKRVAVFTPNAEVYSIPFLRALFYDGTPQLTFLYARRNGTERIFVKVDGSSSPIFYDFSDHPRKKTNTDQSPI
ncbi:hypothetical protein [Flavobacterium sp. 3HN19-14]|uniref:hypothetical protein n=1 Tax=Flavobacterium sp. 3HN19-14 TaxID=3448133 RepID=UPI003EE0CA7E